MSVRRWWIAPALLAAVVGVGAPSAVAGEAEDHAAVRADWQDDGRITPCRFSREELESARRVAEGNPDHAYTDFPSDLDAEIARHRSGACAGRTPDSVRDRSPLAALRVARVAPRGGAAREYVKLRNTSRRSVSLRGATIRNRSRGRIRLPSGLRIGPRRTLIVHVRCAPGRRAPSVSRGHGYGCLRGRALFADSGDVARLADRGGIVVSARGFGRHRRAAAF